MPRAVATLLVRESGRRDVPAFLIADGWIVLQQSRGATDPVVLCTPPLGRDRLVLQISMPPQLSKPWSGTLLI